MSIGQVYNSKDKNDDSIKVRKTFMVSVDRIFIKEGHNIRDIDENHVDEIAECYRNGIYLPPIVVVQEGERFYPDDGHHRYLAAIKAGVTRLECADSTGDEIDRTVLMITSSQGLALAPLARANGYLRLQRQGLTNDEIAVKCNRSRADIDNHLLLLTSGEQVQQAVKKKEIGVAAAVSAVRKHGNKAAEVVTKAVTKAKAEGKTKATLSSVSGFSNTDAMAIVKIVVANAAKIHIWGLTKTSEEQLGTLIRKYNKTKATKKKAKSKK